MSILAKAFNALASSPTAAPPISYSSGRTFTLPWVNKVDREGQMSAYGAVGILFQIVNRCANTTASVDWKLYRKARSGKPEDRTEVTSHLALDVWNNPNPFYTRQEFVESIQQHIDLTGEGWWVIGKSGTLPLELWPVRPDKMDVVPSPDKFLAGYIYHGPDGEKVPLALGDVIQIRMPSPLDPYRGMGPVQSVLIDLDADKYSAQWNRNFFLNSAEPGGIIEVEKRLTDHEFDEMTTRWREQHQGVANAHRVAVLEQGKWVDRKFTMRDMQFAELRQLSGEKIREAFGFPKPMLGTTEDVNRANAEAAAVVFTRWLIVPRLERIKHALNSNFLPMFGTGTADLEFDYESPIPEDEEAEDRERLSKAQSAKLYIDAGWPGKAVAAALELPAELADTWEKPAPPPVPMLHPAAPGAPGSKPPPAAPGTQQKPPAPGTPGNWADAVEHLLPFEIELTDTDGEFVNVKRWQAVEHIDDNTCQACKDNNGQTYTTRAEAYADYPGGTGYVNCEGRDNCRGHVMRRGKKGQSDGSGD